MGLTQVKTDGIAADAVTGAKVADDQIDSEHYIAASIDNEHLADNAVGLAEMAHGTDGNLITYDASGAPDHVATGSSGQVLTSNGAGTAPTFQDVAVVPKSFRNLMINGAMNVAQRATSETSGSGIQNFSTVDRWRITWGGLDAIVEAHQEQLTSSDTGPWALGFRNAWKLVNGSQGSGAGAADYIHPQYAIEAQDIASSGWVHTDPNSKITLSFWVKSSVAQTFYAYVRSMHGTSQSYPISYAVSANTWTKVTKTIPGHANVQIDNDNSAGLYLFFPTFFGTDRTDSGVSLNAWGAYSGSARTPDYTTSNSSWYNTNDATWHLTGVQVEVGDTATKFEHRQYGDELLRCQRYFYTITSIPGLTHATEDLGAAFAASGTEVQFPLNFPVFMRSTPAIEQRQGTEWFLIGQGNYGGNKFLSNNWIINNMAPNRGNLYTAPDANLSSYIGQMGTIQSKNTSARLGMVSEI